MRVGLSTSVIQRGHTGIARYVLSLVRSIIESKREIELVLFVLEDDLDLFSFTGNRAVLIPIQERYRSAARDVSWHQTVLPRLARKHQLDLLHIPSYRRMLWPQPCPLIATIHDLASFHVRGKYDWKRMLYARYIVRHLAQRQSSIIAISENTARDIQRFLRVPAKRITIIHNGIDHDRFKPADRESARAAIVERQRLAAPFFLYVARLEHPGKNHVRLIDAFNRFKAQSHSKWRLVLAGSDWHGADAIHAAIAQSPYSTDISCLGFVADGELPTLYAAADAFVYPSLFEGFGLPPVEAMACGCPVICSNRGALGEVVGRAALIVDPEDTGQISEALTRVAADPSLRSNLRSAGLLRAQHFTWPACANATIEAYHSCLRSSPARQSVFPAAAGAFTP